MFLRTQRVCGYDYSFKGEDKISSPLNFFKDYNQLSNQKSEIE